MPYQVALGKDHETLVSDSRLERVFYQLQKLTDFPDNTEFASFIQEPNEREKRRLAVFIVTTPHPRKDKRALTLPKVISISAMPLERWIERDKINRHFASLSDPIRPVFAGLLRRHLKHYSTLKQNVEESIN